MRPAPQRSELAAPMLIRDCMDETRSMLDGKVYDSKSSLRRTYKEAGVVEIGNDSSYTDTAGITAREVKAVKEKKAKHRKAVSQTVEKALSRAGLGA
tara:strand:- start:9524 stop:9814 length:291 start_codon:yes stop_codon:yes gene_type:complete